MMLKKTFLITSLIALVGCSGCQGSDSDTGGKTNETPSSITVLSTTIPLADPYILLHEGVYYLYGTEVGTGFDVYYSNDLEHWVRLSNLSLSHTNSFGESKFWAPEVYYVEKEKKFYLFYSAEEHICVATSDSPLGPFMQEEKKPIREEPSIDTSVLFDDNGKAYLYFVRFNDGNVIWCAELEDDLKTIKEETLTECFKAEADWELILPKVVEGPSVFKQDGVYYMMYSANGYTSQDYAVGFATATSPFGPWKKDASNPILHNYMELVGVGHGAPFYDKTGKMRYVFHAHKSSTEIHPRKTYITDLSVNNHLITVGNDFIRPMVVDKLPENS